MDSLRPDHLGCYGYGRDTSPAVDAFAAGAVRFDQTIASGSWTQPSIMSMMTSVPADVHQRVHWDRPHSTNVVTLAETLQKAGYQTVGLVANPMTNRKFGFSRRFDFYDDYSLTGAPDATTGDIARQTAQGAKLTRLAQDWIERRRDPEKPLFLFVLYIDVHWDYLPPPPFNRMFAPDPVPPPRDIWNLGRKTIPEAARKRSVAAYDGEIRYTDGCISNLLAAIDASPCGKDTVENMDWLAARRDDPDFGKVRVVQVDDGWQTAPDAVYHDRTATRAQALRRGLEAIRRGFGDDGFILGGTMVFGPAAGLVDAMRVSTDITPRWDRPGQHAEAPNDPNVCRNVVHHAYMDGRLWINDPDTLIVREDRNELTPSEVELWAGVVSLAGGSLMLSDRLSALSPGRLALVRRALAGAGQRTRLRPADRWEKSLPSVWEAERDGRTVRAVFDFDGAHSVRFS
ncbi:MAG: sulfatase-like hydrolase/transferase [Kiritimatiellae bacterium]|nr:sulfatase-like hydrolase/transferase [Kiritimatiellia bacterium]